MKVKVNRVTGIDDAIISMFMSKRSWSWEKQREIEKVCDTMLASNGALRAEPDRYVDNEQFQKWMDTLTKFGTRHITMLRFIDFSISVEGLHRGGQDDWDSHAMRFNNRIIRNSTRIKGSNFGYELSDWYSDKILPTDMALSSLGITLPDEIQRNGKTYVKAVNGYIVKGMENNNDVKRGLYMMSIPSDFIFKVNLTEWAHVYKERNKDSTANPEVKILCEGIADQMQSFHKQFNRDLFEKIRN